ncbi:MAG: VWA domain-containing protein [Deltaproteobacteria bacterium]|nr:VWA domain-containing protein [Deltaproteobacteria bacterium]
MEFLNPAALYAFFLLPLLLIPYLIKGRPRRLVFSSLLFFQDFSSRSAGRPWGSLRLPPIFFLQLLLLSLLILALAEPVFSVRPLKIAIILDNSASMQALERRNGGRKSRFEMARDEARDLLSDFSARSRIDLFLTVPRLEQVGGDALTPGEALTLITTLSPYDLGEPPGDYGEELLRLKREKGYERIFFLTDHPVRGQGGAISVISVGRPKENLAITSFHLSRSSFASPQLEARVEVTNFSSNEEKVRLSLKGGERVLSTRALSIAPHRKLAASFKGFPIYQTYEAELEVSDSLALDNRRFAVLPVAERLEILGISPRPEALSSLRSIPGLSLNLVSPGAYEKSRGKGHALEIFHFSTPALLPQKHALFVLPPKENPLVAVGKPLSRPVISGWREPHPLTRYVNFALFRPTYARPLKPLSFGETIIQSPEGPLVVALERQGLRYLVLGFDPFPYLGRDNLPLSIFTLNLLGWFYEGLGSSSTATGGPLYLRAQNEGGELVTPKGEKFPLGRDSSLFSRTFFQGLYRVVHGREQEFMAVNLQDVKESDLTSPAPISLREDPGLSGSQSFFFSLWPYLLLLSILSLFLEWFLNPPAIQAAHGTNDGRARPVP